MKAYIATTCLVFVAVTIAHIMRMVGESGGPGGDPWYILLTLVTAAFAVWAGLLLVRARRSSTT
jgi:hypothetical protein